ncbi:zinc finger protein 518A [Echeneis naucrates]|nr:zinc finger protein 518A [Echeneis naucrates]XP_029383380.1 zinc finger protein 518A [Echeneis naucrates]XP_029383381.1 zinc finger protein 518A [Echeneis naucrates]XP_029383382.1 zinc finger protein 518A [Echeneis naucrates]XP_029383383.1 zinc finger protein 518A [Echeneis naucrates]XP_029383384.1 zinc finger protein 518A [Echeneis naucrates]XP_029383385.1 zinc finger protein 518A [Echeneis naucrates]
MEEDLIIPRDSARNCNISVIEDDKVKDFVYKHFGEVTDGSLFNNAVDSTIREHGVSTKKEKQTLNKASCKIQQGAVFSGKILSFGCSVCKDDSTYSPNDLLKHFRAAHKGILPTYPCDLCGFVTNEFSALQRHRIEHRNTLVTCELCNDDVQYSLLLLTRHYIMCHSLNGQFNCDWCEFTTVDAGTFVQHIHHHNESPWKCSKCRHISLNEEDHQRHVKAHLGTFPFTCQICGYGTVRSEYLDKHTAAVHKQEAEKRNAWKAIEDNSTSANSSAALKALLKKSGEDVQRTTKLNCLSGNLTNQNGRLIKAELSLEETHHCADGTTVKKDNNWNKSPNNTEKISPVMLHECDNSTNSDSASHTNPNGLTVLMVKNKISLPPNCTTKVMGFKIVDGKKHLVLKVIPAAKQDSSIQNQSLLEEVGFLATNPVLDKSKNSIENGDCTDSKSSTSHCFAVSPIGGSCIQVDQDDIMAVKVKIEEEETSIYNLDSTPQRDVAGEQTNSSLGVSSTSTESLYPMTNYSDHVGDQSHPQTTCSERNTFDNSSVSATLNCNATSHSGGKISNILCSGKVTSLSSEIVRETLIFESVSRKTAENCGVASDLSFSHPVADKFGDEQDRNSCNTVKKDDKVYQSTPAKTNRFKTEIKSENDKQNFQRLSINLVHLSGSSVPNSGSCRDGDTGSENCTQKSLNQEVFNFHNYSKETFCPLPNTPQSSEHSAIKSINESPQFSLALAESPQPFTESGNRETDQEKHQEDVKKVPSSDINADESTASIDDPTKEDENLESVLQDFNIIKIEEESIPISKKIPETKSTSTICGSFVEEHSDAIINQQLNRERFTSSSANDSLKQTKTTLRILQLPEGQQSVLLRTSESRLAMPVQVKTTPGFKLIANSANPQINVSYMKPGTERSCNQTDVSSTPKCRRLNVSTPMAGPAEKAASLLSAVQPGLGTTSNHYLINSPGLKGPVLLSSTPHNVPTDRSSKLQPTCYLVQRSVPFVHNPSIPGLRLASTQLPLNSRPVLAMPVSSVDKTSSIQPGRQAFLLRYISPPKSGLLLNNQEKKNGTQKNGSQTSESNGNKVIFKIVTPSGSLLTSGATTSSSQPMFLATRPQTQCFLVSSNKTNANASNGVKKLITLHKTAQKDVKEPCISLPQMNLKTQQCEADKPILAPRPIRPPSQRKRRRKPLFDELPAPVHKARRLTNKVLTEKETAVLWKPIAKEVERTLRLVPFSSVQQIKCPRRYQPVVVLNHPDADIPEVANIMKVVYRYKGAVTKVSLSQKTIQELSELGAQEKDYSTKGVLSHSDEPRPVQSSVRERFLLKLKLRKKSKKKYEVVKTSGCRQESVVFDCWFCGRLFNSQEDWIGHGQRHLMEATRDWNKLF